jgi:hypothetical protein
MNMWHYIKPGMMDDETVGPIEETVFIEKLRSGEIKAAWMVGSPQATGGQWTKAENLAICKQAIEDGHKIRQLQKEAKSAGKLWSEASSLVKEMMGNG